MDIALTLVAFIVAFFMSFYVYRRGLKDGLSISNGAKTIEPVKTPATSLKEYIEQRDQAKVKDNYMDTAKGILFYDDDEGVT